MAKKEKQQKGKLTSKFFTAEVFGMALALLCVLSLLCLATGGLLFGDVSVKIGAFFLGSLGYCAFPILALFAYLGVKLLIGFKIENPSTKKFFIYAPLYALFIGLILQSALTTVTAPFNEYVAYCYGRGLSISTATPGGVFLGSIAHLVSDLVTPVGAYVIYSLAIVTLSLLLFREQIKNAIVLAREGEGESEEEKPTSTPVAATLSSSESEDFVTTSSFEGEGEKNTRKVIFGGGSFEKKSGADKNNPTSVKVLFGGDPFARKGSSKSFGDPVVGGKSYRASYDEDIDNKTDFVRKPHQPSPKAVVSPMGGRYEEYDYKPEVKERVDIDVSGPEKDVYVFNTKGKTTQGIHGFERRARGEDYVPPFTREQPENPTNPYNVSRFSPELSNRNPAPESNSRFERNDNPTATSTSSTGDFGRSDYGRSDFGRSDTNTRSDFGRSDYGTRSGEPSFDRSNPREPSFGSERPSYEPSSSDYNSRTQTSGQYSREEIDFRDQQSQGDSSIGGTVESFERSQMGNPFAEGGRGERSQPTSPTDFSQEGGRTTEEEKPFVSQNPITRAMRESETNTNTTAYNENPSSDEEQSNDQNDYNGDGFAGGSFFIGEGKKRTVRPSFERDRSHQVTGESHSNKPSEPRPIEQPKPTPSPIRGRQISMTDIPEENQLINPIDNIPKNYKYAFPPISLLYDYNVDEVSRKKNEEEQLQRASTICTILKNSNIDAKIEDIKYGPAITRFEISIPPTTSIKRITEKQDDLNLWIAARDKIRMVAPIQGTSRIGIEVPNATPATVGLKGLIESREFKTAKQSSLSFCLGKDIVGKPVILDIAKMPHLLVAGATGTGKSVFLNTLLVSLIYKYTPEELRIILVDPKVVEFSIFKGIPNLMFNEIFTDNAKVCSMLEWAVQEMEDRYRKLNDVLAKNIEEYNAYMEKKKGKKIPKILIIIDEFADLMNSSSERKLMENKISRLAAKARAAGIHLIMATQRPSADIMEGSIKTNFTSRIAFKMSSNTDSLVIMGEGGAEKLLGRGDVLFRTSSMPSSERAQGCFVDSPEIDQVCRYVKEHNECYYDEFALEKILKGAQEEDNTAPAVDGGGGGVDNSAKSDEELMKKAMRIAISTNNLSISGMQRKLSIGFPKAGKLMDMLVEKGYVSETLDNKNRKIYMTKEQFAEIFGEPF